MPCPNSIPGSITPLDALPFDADERAVLRIARMAFRSFACPESQAWIGGIGASLGGFDHRRAPHVFIATVAAVQAMRQSRRSVFRFNDPCCPDCAGSVTHNERLFLSALRAMRNDAPDRAAALATILCEGNDAGPWLMALRTLAVQMPGCAAGAGADRDEVARSA